MGFGDLIFIVFCSLAIINALLFSGYIWFKKNRNNFASALLSLFLFIIAYRITQMLLHDLQDDFDIGINPSALFFFIPTIPLAGPLLLFYVKTVSLKDFMFRPKHLLHLLPFTAILIIDLLSSHNLPLSQDRPEHYLFYCIELSVILVQFLVYIIVSFAFVRGLVNQNKPERLLKDYINPRQVRTIILVIFFIWIFYAIFCIQIFLRFYTPVRVFEAFYYSLFSYWLLYNELNGQRITSVNNFTARQKPSSLLPDDAIHLKNKILDHIINNEPHKDHNITLGKFAGSISLTPHVVSRVINEQFSCNFNDLINSYRVEEAKKMLGDAAMKNFTVASIAYDCGFNTLSAFNAAFKKFTGLTPSGFRDSQS